jgi:hypothetical protein
MRHLRFSQRWRRRCCLQGWRWRQYVIFQVLKAANMKMAVLWVVAPCSLVEVYRRFRGACCLYHQGDKYSSPWWQKQQADYTAQHPKRQSSSRVSLVKTHENQKSNNPPLIIVFLATWCCFAAFWLRFLHLAQFTSHFCGNQGQPSVP